jgi:hypothetical protein
MKGSISEEGKGRHENVHLCDIQRKQRKEKTKIREQKKANIR